MSTENKPALIPVTMQVGYQIPLTPAPQVAQLDHSQAFPKGRYKASEFTVLQQQEIGNIIELWWRAKMAAIETDKVQELTDKLDYLIAMSGKPKPKSADVQQWKAHQIAK